MLLNSRVTIEHVRVINAEKEVRYDEPDTLKAELKGSKFHRFREVTNKLYWK